MPSANSKQMTIKKDWRYYLGLTCLLLAMIMPLFALVVLQLEIPAEAKATLVGFLALGGPEVAAIAAAALLGKDTLNLFKSRAFSLIRKLLPSKPASKFRYYASLTVMVVSWLGWYAFYFRETIPQELTGQIYLALGDITFVIAFIIAGPEFWEKVHRIFSWEGRLQDVNG